MTAVLHAAPQTREDAARFVSATQATTIGAPGSRRCPECLQAVKPSKAAGFRNMFCCETHRQAHHNRATVRGRKLVPLVMAARITRDGSARDKETGKRTRRQSRSLMDAWAREDREAGRMPADEFAALRHKLGHDDGLFS